MSKREAQEYFGGLPTDPEVRKLREHFGDMQKLRGTTISHEDIEKVIGVKREDNRYKTITNAWRKRIRKETGVEIRGDLAEVIGIGFRVLTDGEQVTFSTDLRQRGAKRIRHSHIALANTDEEKLTDEQKRERAHGLHAAKMLHTALIESRRFLPEPPKSPQG